MLAVVVPVVSGRISDRSGVAESPSTQYGPSVVVVPCVQVVVPLPELVAVPVLDVDDVDVEVDELEDVEDDELVELLAIVVTGVPPVPQPTSPAAPTRLIKRIASRRE